MTGAGGQRDGRLGREWRGEPSIIMACYTTLDEGGFLAHAKRGTWAINNWLIGAQYRLGTGADWNWSGVGCPYFF